MLNETFSVIFKHRAEQGKNYPKTFLLITDAPVTLLCSNDGSVSSPVIIDTSKLSSLYGPGTGTVATEFQPNNAYMASLLSQVMYFKNKTEAWCLKITEKVSFNIASEASYVYILSGQKFIKKCQKWSNLASF